MEYFSPLLPFYTWFLVFCSVSSHVRRYIVSSSNLRRAVGPAGCLHEWEINSIWFLLQTHGQSGFFHSLLSQLDCCGHRHKGSGSLNLSSVSFRRRKEGEIKAPGESQRATNTQHRTFQVAPLQIACRQMLEALRCLSLRIVPGVTLSYATPVPIECFFLI